jgi:hypothetical protein
MVAPSTKMTVVATSNVLLSEEDPPPAMARIL